MNEGERGWALVSVLWVVTMLGLLAAATEALTVTSSRAEHEVDVAAALDADLDAGLARAVVGIADARPANRWRVDGTAQSFAFDGAKMKIAIQDELGRIDLNAADGSMIRRLLQSAGLDPERAAQVTDKILDWRTTTDLSRLHGATGADYAARGYAWRPRHGAFQSVDELKLVMGMTQALFARIRPALTVYSKRPAIDPTVAPAEALRALYLEDPGTVDDILQKRASVAQGDGSAAAGTIDPAFAQSGHTFEIRIALVKKDGRKVRSAVVLLTGDPAKPYLVLAWS